MSVTFSHSREATRPEVVSAWDRYLRAIRVCPAETYDETEEAAWKHLVDELASIHCPDPGAAPRPLEGSQAR